MHWINNVSETFSQRFSQSAQAVRKHVRRADKPQMIEFSRDLLALSGLAIFVASWIAMVGYLGV